MLQSPTALTAALLSVVLFVVVAATTLVLVRAPTSAASLDHASALAAVGAHARQLLHRDDSSSSDSDSDDDDDSDSFSLSSERTEFGGRRSRNVAGNGCAPDAVAHAYFAALNDHRFDAWSTMFTPDALRCVNGRLDSIANGKPYTTANLKCLMERGRLEFHVGDVVTSGQNVVAVSSTLLVQRAMTGLAVVLELDPATCRIETERVFVSGDTPAAQQLKREFLCSCMPLLEELGECTPEEADAEIDVLSIVEECYRHVVAGDAEKLAACFTDDVRFVVNGEAQPSAALASVDAWNANFDEVSYAVDVQHTLVEGLNVHVVVRFTHAVRATGASADQHQYQVLRLTPAGEIESLLTASYDAEIDPLLMRARREAPAPVFWSSLAAVRSLQQFTTELGFPTDYTDFMDQPNFAQWLPETLADAADYCLASVTVSDQNVVRAQPTSHVVFALVTVEVNANGRENDVRDINDALTYDSLTNELTSLANGLGEAVVDLYLGASVARGQMTPQQARSAAPGLLAGVYSANGDLTAEFRRLRADLCALVR